MSEVLVTPAKSAPASAPDSRIIAHVERWMAVIREMRQNPAKN